MKKITYVSLLLGLSLFAVEGKNGNVFNQDVENTEFGKFIKKFGVLEENKGYASTNKDIKSLTKKLGYYASTKEVEAALAGEKINGKKVVVTDSRTKAEQDGLYLQGALKPNLRGWNVAFNNKNLHSSTIGAIYSYCRTGTDQADNIIKLQYLFQGKAKVFGLKDMAEACYPLASKNGKVLDAKLNAKKVFVQKAKDGSYYEVNCPQVKNECSPIDVYSKEDISLAKEMDEKLPLTMTMKNKKLKQEIVVNRASDNRYYKQGCGEAVTSSAVVWEKTCSICHGANGEGNSKTPALNNSSKEYLAKKIKEFIDLKDSTSVNVTNETMAHNMNVILKNKNMSIDPKQLADYIHINFNKNK